jgi:hypothetical protein
VRFASSTTLSTIAASSSGFLASRSCSVEGLWSPAFSAPSNRCSIETEGSAPTAPAYEFAFSPRNTKSTGPISFGSSVAGG